MGVIQLGGAVYVATKVAKRLKKNRANRSLAKEVAVSVASAVRTGKSPYEDELRSASQQEVLAMLVDGVYYRDRDSSDFKLLVKPLIEGEYEVDEWVVHFTSTLYWTRLKSICQKEERKTGIKHYIRHPRNPNKSAPSLVIATRGTKLSKCRDIVADIKIALSTLQTSGRFEKSRDLVKKIIEEYAKWQRGDHDDSSESSHRGYASRSSDPAEHRFVCCDVCNMVPIIGPRYKSNVKDDYDLCQKCFQKYGASKDYTKFDKPLGRQAPQSNHREFASWSSGPPPSVHQNARCDVCNMVPIIGPRYKSNVKDNYDLCQKCFQKYGASKDFAQYDEPLGRQTRAALQIDQFGYNDDDEDDSEFDGNDSELDGDDSELDDDDYESENDMMLVLSRLALKPVQHAGVQCDICRRVPIVGIRYKSIKKHDYDLCPQCFQEHGVLKDYTKIEKPLRTTSSSSLATVNDIYITGHSLGAALALQIGKWLATKEKKRYNVHCFNPPFMTIVQLIQQGMFISKAKELLRKTPLLPVIDMASDVKSIAKLALAWKMDNRGQLVEELTHYFSLHDWVPVLYINKHDCICNKFKKYYKQKQKLSATFEVCSQALISKILGRRALFSSLVPSVDIRVSKRLETSHALKNWYLDPVIDKRRQYRLIPERMIRDDHMPSLPDDSLAGSPVLALADAILYAEDSDLDFDDDPDDDEVETYNV